MGERVEVARLALLGNMLGDLERHDPVHVRHRAHGARQAIGQVGKAHEAVRRLLHILGTVEAHPPAGV